VFYPRDSKLAAAWGTIGPYCKPFNPQTSPRTTWPDRAIQILAAGLDGSYGPRGNGKEFSMLRVTALETVETFTAADGFTQPHDVDPAECDNLTNFGNKPLGELQNDVKR
jgi:hypothetical protein